MHSLACTRTQVLTYIMLHCDCLICPSWGLTKEKLEHIQRGLEVEPFHVVERDWLLVTKEIVHLRSVCIYSGLSYISVHGDGMLLCRCLLRCDWGGAVELILKPRPGGTVWCVSVLDAVVHIVAQGRVVSVHLFTSRGSVVN